MSKDKKRYNPQDRAIYCAECGAVLTNKYNHTNPSEEKICDDCFDCYEYCDHCDRLKLKNGMTMVINHDGEEIYICSTCFQNGMELTKKQIERRDFVDNLCDDFIFTAIDQLGLMGASYPDKDNENISVIREALQEVIVEKMNLCTSMKFYPYID